MNTASPADDQWPEALARRIDEQCDRFPAAWQAALAGGPRPQIEDVLKHVAVEDRATLLPDLIALEREYASRYILPAPTPTEAADLQPVESFQSLDEASADLGALSFSIPGYEILGELGRGGTGVVCKACRSSPWS